MAFQPDSDDPFSGGEKLPSLSWKDLPIGSLFTLEVLEPAKAIQSRDFDTNEPACWDNDATRPKMSAVVNVTVKAGPHSVGEDRSIWAQIPSNLFIAIKEAQKTAGARLAPGGVLHLRFDGEKPHERKGFNPIKQYKAKYEPPAVRATADVFGETPAPPPIASRPTPATGASSW